MSPPYTRVMERSDEPLTCSTSGRCEELIHLFPAVALAPGERWSSHGAASPASCLEMGTLRLSRLGATLPLPTCSPRGGAYTLLPEAVQEAAEDALVRAAIRVGEQHIHITTGCLSPSV